MEARLRRRTVQHLLAGVLPLVLVGTVVIVVLAVRFADAAGALREATASASATVVRSGLGADRRGVELRWVDERGVERTSQIRAATEGDVPAGTQVQLRHVPGDPTRAYVSGDETSARLTDLAYAILTVLLVVVVVMLITSAHVVRRLSAERRPTAQLPVTYARSKRGLVRRAWLVVAEAGREWWVPVHWDPVLTTLLAKTPVPVHGRPMIDRVVVTDVEGTPVWQSGRRRRERPGGEITMSAPEWSRSARRRAEAEAQVRARTAPPLGLLRHVRTELRVAIAAPLIGLLWAYLDDGGAATFGVATLLAACLLLWLSVITGSDPT